MICMFSIPCNFSMTISTNLGNLNDEKSNFAIFTRRIHGNPSLGKWVHRWRKRIVTFASEETRMGRNRRARTVSFTSTNWHHVPFLCQRGLRVKAIAVCPSYRLDRPKYFMSCVYLEIFGVSSDFSRHAFVID